MTSTTADVASERSLFLSALAVVSLLPLLCLSTARVFAFPALGEFNFAVAFLATGFHVALTPFFYIEPELTEFRREHPLRFVWVPLMLCVLPAALVVALPASLPWIIVFYFAWQLYHFQRQNVGVLAFVSIILGTVRTTRTEHIAIELAAYAGILGFLALGGVPLRPIEDFSGTLYRAGLALQILAIAVAIGAWVVRVRREGWSWFSPWHLLCTAFFAGTFVVNDIRFAFGTYAYAHGLQYIVFMYLLSFSRGRTVSRLSPVALTGLGFVGAVALTVVADRARFAWSHDAIYAVYLGLVMSHFVVDAIVWRLSEPVQRQYVRRGFAFVWD